MALSGNQVPIQPCRNRGSRWRLKHDHNAEERRQPGVEQPRKMRWSWLSLRSCFCEKNARTAPVPEDDTAPGKAMP